MANQFYKLWVVKHSNCDGFPLCNIFYKRTDARKFAAELRKSIGGGKQWRVLEARAIGREGGGLSDELDKIAEKLARAIEGARERMSESERIVADFKADEIWMLVRAKASIKKEGSQN